MRILARSEESGVPTMGPRTGSPPAGPGGDGMAAARAQAAAILFQARTQARALINAARATGEAAADAERQIAREQGYRDGQEAAHRDMDQLLAQLAGLVGTTVEDRQGSLRRMDAEIARLVLDLTRTVVHHELRLSADTVLSVVRAALEEMSVETAVVVRVNPAEVTLVQSQAAALGLPATVSISIVADPEVGPGGCVLESGAGRVDARIDVQIQAIEGFLNDNLAPN